VKEKHKIYIFSVLSHGVVAAVAYLIIYLMELAWPELSPRANRSFSLIYYFLIYWGTGFIFIPFLNPYESSYRYFFRADRDKRQGDR